MPELRAGGGLSGRVIYSVGCPALGSDLPESQTQFSTIQLDFCPEHPVSCNISRFAMG